MMRTTDTVRRTIDFLCRPFIQRLITLVISTLLAMSLISTISVLTIPLIEREVASSTLVAHPGAVHVQDLVPQMRPHEQVSAQRAEQHESERRLV